MVHQLISDLLQSATGQLIEKSRVIDHLLDLRLAALDDHSFVSAVDRALEEIPGVSVVAVIWWKSTLSDLSEKVLIPRACL